MFGEVAFDEWKGQTVKPYKAGDTRYFQTEGTHISRLKLC
jgi:hypothetical protein